MELVEEDVLYSTLSLCSPSTCYSSALDMEASHWWSGAVCLRQRKAILVRINGGAGTAVRPYTGHVLFVGYDFGCLTRHLPDFGHMDVYCGWDKVRSLSTLKVAFSSN